MRGELQQAEIRGGGIAEQAPRKTDFGHARAHKFERDPQKRSADARQQDAALGQTVDAPSEGAGQNSEDAADQENDAPAAGFRKAAVNGEHRGDPRHAGDHEKHRMQKAAKESHFGPRAKKHDQQNADANPGIDAEIKTGVRKRKRRAGQRGRKRSGKNPELPILGEDERN